MITKEQFIKIFTNYQELQHTYRQLYDILRIEPENAVSDSVNKIIDVIFDIINNQFDSDWAEEIILDYLFNDDEIYTTTINGTTYKIKTLGDLYSVLGHINEEKKS